MAEKKAGTVAGVHYMVGREDMVPGAVRMRDAYAIKAGAPIYQKEFGFGCLDRWKKEGMPEDVPMSELFGYDPPGSYNLGQLGWCESPFHPAFENKVLEDRGEYELVQDSVGRRVLCFKGRRSGFMPTYEDDPVKDWKTWEEDCKWRLDPNTPSRYADLEKRMQTAREEAATGKMIFQNLVGGYMYLRSLAGPEKVMYLFYEQADLIHDIMETWLKVMDAVITRHQEHVTIDVLFLAEDICYNHGLLISPDMMREFLFPYYQQLITNIRSRQIDKERHLYIQIDTDGDARPSIPVYREIGMDAMLPFEVAA
ncbi:MAG: hypothetical protein ACOC54_02360, partial [Candidatus Sumerlaeota bacterium]